MSKLKKVTFDCEVITPMFLAGADQNQPEIRTASLRGQLRWWFRAIYGGMNGGDNKDCMEKETALFGGTTGKEAGQSKVWIKVASSFDPNQKERISPLPHKNTNFTFLAIPVGTAFRVDIRSKSKFGDEFNCVTPLIELSSLLGGLGRRSRRGFGSYQISSNIYETREEVENVIKDAIQSAQNTIRKVTGISNESLPKNDISPWPIISKDHFKLKIADPEDWDGFIKKLMNKLSDGLSDKHQDPKLDPKVLGDAKGGRQASTLLVSVIKLSSGQILPIFSQFFCKTKDKPRRSDFENLDSFPERIFHAQEIKV